MREGSTFPNASNPTSCANFADYKPLSMPVIEYTEDVHVPLDAMYRLFMDKVRPAATCCRHFPHTCARARAFAQHTPH
ncbi:hypothetical protein EON67_10365, partial [archaeon]